METTVILLVLRILRNVCVPFYKNNATTLFTTFSLNFLRKQLLKIVPSMLVQTTTSKYRHNFETILHRFNNNKSPQSDAFRLNDKEMN